MTNSLSGHNRDRSTRTRRSIGRVSAVAIAISAAGAASFVTAFAHHIVSTTPTPATGVVNKTPLADTALVYSDSSRHIEFSLWAPNTCGTEGATPVFTDSEPVTASTITNSTVTSATYVPKEAGVYEWTAEVIINDSGGVESGPTACGDEQVTINKVATHITTTPSGADGAAVGTLITDSATLTGGFNPTGTVTFLLYGPSNTDCANGDNSSHGWMQRWVVPLSGDGTASVPAPGFTPWLTGTYNWIADYSGDSNNMPAHDSCGAEMVRVDKASPTIATTVWNSGPVGTRIGDSAQVSGGDNPTGTVTFNLFPPSNPTCSTGAGATGPVQTVTVPLAANGSATTTATPYTTTEIGTYDWVAKYNGDVNNNSATSKCGDEQVTIGKDGTSIVTKASAGGIPGTAIHDTATVTGTIRPTGTVTFSLYGPADTSCKAAPIFTSSAHVDASGSAVSASFSATATAGTYNWVAAYSGDANSSPSHSKCGAEPVVIKVAGGVQGITTPGTGAAEGPTQTGMGIGFLFGGIALLLGGGVIRERRRA